MANASQLYLLADHIKLSLLERQRAISLNLEPNAQDGNISRSLESMREGIEALEQDPSPLEEFSDHASRLRAQHDDLTSQFRGFSVPSTATSQPNTPALQSDFANAQDARSPNATPSVLKQTTASPNPSKSVRFTDEPDAEETANRSALFPYRDEPEGPPDQNHLSNESIHQYHSAVIQEQDEQLDRLGHSIGRQRDLSIQIGDELDEHVQMLDDVEAHVDRHQTRLDGARKSLGTFARKANDNKQMTTIVVLIIVLVLLIVILKG